MKSWMSERPIVFCAERDYAEVLRLLSFITAPFKFYIYNQKVTTP